MTASGSTTANKGLCQPLYERGFRLPADSRPNPKMGRLTPDTAARPVVPLAILRLRAEALIPEGSGAAWRLNPALVVEPAAGLFQGDDDRGVAGGVRDA
jgi:hypothetical protein